MVISKEVELPELDELDEPEVNLTSANLMAAGPFLGKSCELINNEFMLCRFENGEDPRPCLEYGKLVTRCTLEFFRKLKKTCIHEHVQYANCLDKSSGNYAPWYCRKTQAVYHECMRTKMDVEYPGFGYFCRGRVHFSGCTDPPEEEPCPCLPRLGDEITPKLADCKKRYAARFTGRTYWMTD